MLHSENQSGGMVATSDCVRGSGTTFMESGLTAIAKNEYRTPTYLDSQVRDSLHPFLPQVFLLDIDLLTGYKTSQVKCDER